MPERDDYPVVPCPRCGRMLKAEGELTMPGVYIGPVHDDNAFCVPAYQCDHCIIRRQPFGPGTEPLEMNLTFIIGPDGKPFDPLEPDGEIDLSV